MMRRLALTSLLLLSTSALGAASLSNAPVVDPSDQRPTPPASLDAAEEGYLQLNRWAVPGNEFGRTGSAIPGNIYVGRVDFSRSGSYQSLTASVWIPYCEGGSGQICQRRFQFALSCREYSSGDTWTVYTPYYRNYTTYGQYETRDYSFTDSDVYYCDHIDDIDLYWLNGW